MIKLLNGAVIAKPPVKPQSLSEKEKRQRENDDVEHCCRYSADDWKHPDFSAVGGPHNWRNYITPQLKNAWPTFTDWQKKVIAHALDDAALHEEWD
ncbi:hypothetical protein GI075_23410 [Salmonella enterica]|uniref:Uncharacterized protein n=1 Tax=Salmonella enterica subsp. enterica serovar Braenderup TaxID=149391 RepID=A0A5Z9CAS0_SALET|nr:hypothetical protein [Salmonella enterica]EBV5772169.1 hypothetical protein [Salmonella enterica subsp. enterica serovar Monophasic]ECB4832025.1 hypothetical protein [Salmonella enterica subsp. enterica serovar Bareilly]ECS7593161.1 hypothetical protein [Salmonella enterica subsp. enterica serovar Norwich]ECT0409073.1 hypothetical protein [Salmonella enterica subsp. enterica serovar Braenderup]ECX2173674.1 hypothetical protein [Salmonella enterica subsp. enterica serovar Newport]EDG1402729